jgi:hypothetical protein
MGEAAATPIDFGGLANKVAGYGEVLGPEKAREQGYEVSTNVLHKPPKPFRWPLQEPIRVGPPPI